MSTPFPPHEGISLELKESVDRLRTSLIDNFDQLTGFVAKHLDDPFFTEGGQRVNLRERIFREQVSNLVTHREYNKTTPAY